jgi:hypothetical protein
VSYAAKALGIPLLALACGAPAGREPGVPVGLRGAVLIEPARLSVGEVARIEVTVVTPPDHRVRPFHPPREIPGFWLLDAETLPTERSAGRWVHLTRLRARAREPGDFAFPGLSLEVEGPGEEVQPLELEARPLTVEAVADRLPGRSEPFPLRAAPEPSAPPGVLLPAAAGALAALVAAAAAGGALRRRRRSRAAPPPLAPPPPAWRATRHELAASLEAAAGDPAGAAGAAGAAAGALRRFLASSFAVPAPTLTTEELGALPAPLGTARSWPALLEVLAALDRARFAPSGTGASQAGREVEELRAAIRRALELLTALSPEARRS